MKVQTIRLDRLLAGSGMGSRKEAGKLAARGRVTVNGAVEKDAARKVDPARDRIAVDGRALRYREHLCLMMNKPRGVVSATDDPKERTVLGLVPARLRRPGLFPAGRLDKDTTGLLLITDDGQLAHGILSPRRHVDKVYRAVLDGPVGETETAAFARGLVLADGTVCLPAVLRPDAGGLFRAEITLREGKYHQVKRMFEAVGRSVLTLERVSMGGLVLDPALRPGECRELTPGELALLRGQHD